MFILNLYVFCLFALLCQLGLWLHYWTEIVKMDVLGLFMKLEKRFSIRFNVKCDANGISGGKNSALYK